MRILPRLIVMVLAAASASAGFAAITVGSGSAVNFADAAVNLGCSDLIVSGQADATSAAISAIVNLNLAGGTFAPAAAQVSLGGNFIDAGTFTPGTSRINIVDACGSGSSTLSGAASFYDFIVSTASGKTLVLPAALTQSIAHTLTLSGVVGGLLQVTSSSAGQRAFLAVAAGAAQNVAYVNVRDNGATNATIAPGAATNYNSVDGGNLSNWFADAVAGLGGGVVATPALGRWGMLLLAALFAVFVWRKRSL